MAVPCSLPYDMTADCTLLYWLSGDRWHLFEGPPTLGAGEAVGVVSHVTEPQTLTKDHLGQQLGCEQEYLKLYKFNTLWNQFKGIVQLSKCSCMCRPYSGS